MSQSVMVSFYISRRIPSDLYIHELEYDQILYMSRWADQSTLHDVINGLESEVLEN